MDTADGKQKERETPERARKRISCAPVLLRPHPKMNPAWRTHPDRYINLLPRASASEPERRSVQPHVNAWIEEGLLEVR